MSLIEKALIIGSLVGVGATGIYYTIKYQTGNISSLSRSQLYEKRLELIQKPNVKMLFSTLSFFYLQGYNKDNLEDFYTFHEMLHLAKPKLIALQLSESTYKQELTKIVDSPSFGPIMERVEYFIKLKSDELVKMKEIPNDHLADLYAFYFCKKNRCSIVYGDRSPEEIEKMYQARLKLNEILKQNEPIYIKGEGESDDKTKINITASDQSEKKVKTEEEIKKEIYYDRRVEFYVDALINKMNPKMSLVPDSPYKTIVGLVDEDKLVGVATQWKHKFKTIYNHEIMEDQEKNEIVNVQNDQQEKKN